jgi:hypothetical protein
MDRQVLPTGIGAEVLAQRHDVHAGLVCENGLVHDLPDRPPVGHKGAGVVLRYIAARVEAEDEIGHGAALSRPVVDQCVVDRRPAG